MPTSTATSCHSLSLPNPYFPATSYLGINYLVCHFLLKLERRDLKAVVIMGSQKSLSMSMTIVGFLGAQGEVGLMTIPCIIGYMSQLYVDAYVSSRWASDVDPEVATHKTKALFVTTGAAVTKLDEDGADGGIAMHAAV